MYILLKRQVYVKESITLSDYRENTLKFMNFRVFYTKYGFDFQEGRNKPRYLFEFSKERRMI